MSILVIGALGKFIRLNVMPVVHLINDCSYSMPLLMINLHSRNFLCMVCIYVVYRMVCCASSDAASLTTVCASTV
jgi:hypothetical protein